MCSLFKGPYVALRSRLRSPIQGETKDLQIVSAGFPTAFVEDFPAASDLLL